MSDSRHIFLDDRWYRIAEDAEGDGYHIRREPLRIPNAQVVRGEAGGQFQLRPDIMQWSITDWSEGEGQIKFDPQQPGRSEKLVNVCPFSQPGNLMLGPLVGRVQYSSADVTTDITLVQGPNEAVHGVEVSTGVVSVFEDFVPSTFSFTNQQVGTTENGTHAAGACADYNYVYFYDRSSPFLYRYDVSAHTYTLLNDQAAISIAGPVLIEMGNYLYAYNAPAGKLWELSKTTINTTTAETPLYDFSESGGSGGYRNAFNGWAVAGDNRIYLLQTVGSDTIIHEVVPTTAAGAGYGRELGRYPGILGYGLLWFGGFLLLLAQSAGRTGSRFEAFYIQPDGALGTLGEIRSHIGDGPSGSTLWPGKANLRYFSFVGPSWDDSDGAVFLVDAVSGGMAQIAAIEGAANIGQIEEVNGIWLVPNENYTNYLRPDRFTSSGYASTPFYDFDVADEKVLREITVTCEALPANTSITVKYDLGDGTLVTAGTIDTDDSEGETFVVSTDASTKTFRHMRVHLTLDTTDNTVSPVVRSIDVRASVVKYVNVWEMLLDLSDDHPSYGRSGAGDAESLLNLQENTVYAFKDAYRSHVEGSETEYDIELDSLDLSFSQPGEGVAHVILRET